MSAAPTSVLSASELVEQIEAAVRPGLNLDRAISAAVGWSDDFTRSLDRALSLLPNGADWRRLTPTSMSVYAASPYSATAQVRYDGYGATIPLQVCAAVFKMRAASEAKASAIEGFAQDAEERLDPQGESAVPKADAPTPTVSQ